MPHSKPISLDAAAAALAHGTFNLLTRGREGSLSISADKWRCAGVEANAVRFEAVQPLGDSAPPRSIALDEIQAITWDRLPKQEKRSQVRFHLTSGDLLTFSGQVDESALAQD